MANHDVPSNSDTRTTLPRRDSDLFRRLFATVAPLHRRDIVLQEPRQDDWTVSILLHHPSSFAHKKAAISLPEADAVLLIPVAARLFYPAHFEY